MEVKIVAKFFRSLMNSKKVLSEPNVHLEHSLTKMARNKLSSYVVSSECFSVFIYFNLYSDVELKTVITDFVKRINSDVYVELSTSEFVFINVVLANEASKKEEERNIVNSIGYIAQNYKISYQVSGNFIEFELINVGGKQYKSIYYSPCLDTFYEKCLREMDIGIFDQRKRGAIDFITDFDNFYKINSCHCVILKLNPNVADIGNIFDYCLSKGIFAKDIDTLGSTFLFIYVKNDTLQILSECVETFVANLVEKFSSEIQCHFCQNELDDFGVSYIMCSSEERIVNLNPRIIYGLAKKLRSKLTVLKKL